MTLLQPCHQIEMFSSKYSHVAQSVLVSRRIEGSSVAEHFKFTNK